MKKIHKYVALMGGDPKNPVPGSFDSLQSCQAYCDEVNEMLTSDYHLKPRKIEVNDEPTPNS